MIERPASKRGAVSPFLAMDMLRSANEIESQGGDVVHMEVGQPSGPPPVRVAEAARAALDKGIIGYTEALGMPALRSRIAQHYRQAYDLNISADRVVVTTGSSGAFMLSFLGAFDAGDKVALPVPGYPAYRNILAALGIDVVPFHLSAADRWAPTAAAIASLAESPGIHGVLVASPSNPTGTMIEASALGDMAQECARRGIWFISDEIYHRLTYGIDAACALSYSDDAIVINSFSKYYCMTGWRIGWMIVPERLVRTMECLAQSLFISPPALSQFAALAAFDASDELDARHGVYKQNRELLLNELPGIGFEDFAPVDGAFYVYANVSRFSNDSFTFAQKMLSEAGVAVTPGADFDERDGHHYVRLSFAGSHQEMIEAVRRLRRWLG
jgi:aspartate/methionine/tyrosine aminotransferase